MQDARCTSSEVAWAMRTRDRSPFLPRPCIALPRAAPAHVHSARAVLLLEHRMQPTPSLLCGLASWPLLGVCSIKPGGHPLHPGKRRTRAPVLPGVRGQRPGLWLRRTGGGTCAFGGGPFPIAVSVCLSACVCVCVCAKVTVGTSKKSVSFAAAGRGMNSAASS